jgi:hypothetical protein
MLSHFVLTMNLYQYWLTPVADCYCLKSLKYQIMLQTFRLYVFHHISLDLYMDFITETPEESELNSHSNNSVSHTIPIALYVLPAVSSLSDYPTSEH